MQRYQRCSFLSLPTSPSLPLSFSLTRSFLSFFPHRIFTQSSRATGALRGNTDPAKEFIEFVVQLIPRRQAGVESGIGGGRYGRGQENREGGLMWRARNCIRGVWLKITQQSLYWTRSCSNSLNPRLPTYRCCKVGETRDICFFLLLFISPETKI